MDFKEYTIMGFIQPTVDDKELVDGFFEIMNSFANGNSYFFDGTIILQEDQMNQFCSDFKDFITQYNKRN